MSTHLKALVKRVVKLCEADLEACHCAEEFILWRIHPLGRREKLAFECLWFADPNHNPSSGKKTLSFIHSLQEKQKNCRLG
jgi:hypothetical protein